MKTLLELIGLLLTWPGKGPRQPAAETKVDAKTVRIFAHAELDQKGAGLNPPSHLIFG